MIQNIFIGVMAITPYRKTIEPIIKANMFLVEAIVGITNRVDGWWLVAIASMAVYWLAYKASIRIARTMGSLLKTCFDYFRF